MPTKKHIKRKSIERTIMDKVASDEITMKPRWYFVLGSFLLIAGVVSFSILGTFLLSLTLFLLRSHGPMWQWRLGQMIGSFPFWIPFFGIASILGGILFLKQYDFSYKKNFLYIIIGFIISLLIAAWIVDTAGVSQLWFTRGPMRRFYQEWQTSPSPSPFVPVPGQGKMKHR